MDLTACLELTLSEGTCVVGTDLSVAAQTLAAFQANMSAGSLPTGREEGEASTFNVSDDLPQDVFCLLRFANRTSLKTQPSQEGSNANEGGDCFILARSERGYKQERVSRQVWLTAALT